MYTSVINKFLLLLCYIGGAIDVNNAKNFAIDNCYFHSNQAKSSMSYILLLLGIPI